MHSKKARVHHLMDMLALGRCKDTFIGDPMARGISGGQVIVFLIRQ